MADLAHSPEQFVQLIEQRLNDPGITPDLMQRRRAVFAHYISDLSTSATERYASKLAELASASAARA